MKLYTKFSQLTVPNKLCFYSYKTTSHVIHKHAYFELYAIIYLNSIKNYSIFCIYIISLVVYIYIILSIMLTRHELNNFFLIYGLRLIVDAIDVMAFLGFNIDNLFCNLNTLFSGLAV